jgi:hypothetical protein
MTNIGIDRSHGLVKWRNTLRAIRARRACRKLPPFEIPPEIRRAAESQGWKFNKR